MSRRQAAAVPAVLVFAVLVLSLLFAQHVAAPAAGTTAAAVSAAQRPGAAVRTRSSAVPAARAAASDHATRDHATRDHATRDHATRDQSSRDHAEQGLVSDAGQPVLLHLAVPPHSGALAPPAAATARLDPLAGAAPAGRRVTAVRERSPPPVASPSARPHAPERQPRPVHA